ncbi:MAG: alpha-ketoglutarate-dependent dioxygenase AlkB family protein [Flavobacteriales bacterium]|jgi:alkylated DNA repair dioxygenase AlkB
MILYQNNKEILELIRLNVSIEHFESIVDQIHWQHNNITVYGKEYQEPRLTAWFGPPYKYSSIQWPGADIPECLFGLKKTAEEYSSFNFNSVLLNYYRNGSDSMGWHSDNEREMNQSCIASVSLGESRKMKFKHKSTKEIIDVVLNHGDLLLMRDFQKNWQHAIPKTTRPLGPRLNLTFREILL